MKKPVANVPMRNAATIMLIRDTEHGLEVFMVRRTTKAKFVAGAYVFPGGAVDEEDYDKRLEQIIVGRSDEEVSGRLGMEEAGLALMVAAIRESFEESGFLIAEDVDGNPIRFEEPEITQRFIQHRRNIHQQVKAFSSVCQQENLRLPLHRLEFFSHWVTPWGQPRRFDTRFFVAAAPKGQTPVHDGRETIDSCWIRPAEALDKSKQGEFKLMAPTINNLRQLGEYTSVEALMRAAPSRKIQRIMPKVVYDEKQERRKILFPDDPEYSTILTPDDDQCCDNIPG